MKTFKVKTKSGIEWNQTGKNGFEAMSFAIINGIHKGMKKGDKIISLTPIE